MVRQPDDRIPFIRILNASDHDSDQLWILAGLARLLNVLRVWTYEIETKIRSLEDQGTLSNEDLNFLANSSKYATQMLKQSFVVVNTKQIKPELAFLEE